MCIRDRHYMYRILRSITNRFGSTAELGIYEMRQDGLRQVSNPSELLLSQDHEGMSEMCIRDSSIICTMPANKALSL